MSERILFITGYYMFVPLTAACNLDRLLEGSLLRKILFQIYSDDFTIAYGYNQSIRLVLSITILSFHKKQETCIVYN